MSNKDKAKAFLELASSGRVQEAYDQFVAPNFIHHNQYFKGDRASLLQAMAESHQASPNKSIDVKRIYEDGSTVITHSEVVRQKADDPSIAVVHIFRFEQGSIVELWDVGMLIDRDSPNQHGVF